MMSRRLPTLDLPIATYVDFGYTDTGYYDSYHDCWHSDNWHDMYYDSWRGDTDAKPLVKTPKPKLLKNLDIVIEESLSKLPKETFWRRDSNPYYDTVSYHDYPGYYDKP